MNMPALNVFKSKFNTWLKKRLPESQDITLKQKRIFIFPNTVGWFYSVLIVLVFVTGVNYQNNLLLSICFLLASLFVVAMLETYRNLAGVRIQSGRIENCFVGDAIYLPLQLSNPSKHSRHRLSIGFDKHHAHVIDTLGQVQGFQLPYSPHTRGRLKVDRFTLFSRYPLGLFHCWTWLYMSFDGLAYPKPIEAPFRQYTGEGGDTGEGQLQDKADADDALDFRPYQKGDPLKHIAWRHYAKTGQLYSKTFKESLGQNRQLHWQMVPSTNTETKLSILCAWVLESHAQGVAYSLTLPTKNIPLNSGDQHLQDCLQALALFPETGEQT